MVYYDRNYGKCAFYWGFQLTRIFHAPDVLSDKAFKGEAVVNYCEPLITQSMAAHQDAPEG